MNFRKEINVRGQRSIYRKTSCAVITLLAAFQLSCESTSGPAVSIVASEAAAAAAAAGSSGTTYTATASCAGTGSESELYIFLTSTTHDGNLGGRAGADAKCVAEKNTNYPTLPCTKIRALVSFGPMDNIANAQTTCNFSSTTPIKRPDGTSIVAAGYDIFLTGPLDNPVTSASAAHWTFSNMGGNQDPAANCQGGTSNDPLENGVTAQADSAMNYITSGSIWNCGQASFNVMCLCY